MGFFSSRLSVKQLGLLWHELGTAYTAGIPLLRSVKLVASATESRGLKRVLRRLAADMEAGRTLTEALRVQRKRFPDFVTNLVAAGEGSGALTHVFRSLELHYDEMLKLRRATVNAVLYPAFVVGVALYVIPVFVIIMTPVAQGRSAGNPLDFIIRSAIGLAINFGILVMLVRLGILPAIWNAIAPRLWPFSHVVRRFALARYFRTLALLLRCGGNLVPALEQSAAVAGNPYITKDLMKAIPAVRDGGLLSDGFEGSRHMPASAVAMLRVGEESGSLDAMLDKIAYYFLQDGMYRVRNVLATLETVLILLIGIALCAGL